MIVVWGLASLGMALGWVFLLAGAAVRMRRGRPWKARAAVSAAWAAAVAVAVLVSLLAERHGKGHGGGLPPGGPADRTSRAELYLTAGVGDGRITIQSVFPCRRARRA